MSNLAGPELVARWLSRLQAEDVDELAGIDRLLAPLGFYSQILDCEIWAPADFRTDYASVPRLPFAYLVVGGKGRKAAVIHDWLYSGGLVNGRRLTRKECDQVFAEALKATGYGWTVESLMYAGVRAGGGSHFVKDNVPQLAHVEALMGAAALEAA
jgi:hypothetical protein